MKKLLIGLTLLTSFSSIAGENYFTTHSNGSDFFDVNIPAFTMLKTDKELLPESVSVSYSVSKKSKSSFILSSFTIYEDGAKPLNLSLIHI